MTTAVLNGGNLVTGQTLSARAISGFFIGLAVFLGGFVLFEPAPYELLLAGMLGISFLFGLKVPRGILPVLVIITVFCFGGVLASFQMDDYQRGLIHTAVTFFLGLTTVFFAILISNDMSRIRLIFRVYVLAAICSTLPGLLGYFGFPGFDIFTRYGRSQGVFADPNVYAPFLVAPILYLMYGILNRSMSLAPVRLVCIGLLLLGSLLAFSRGGWGLLLVTGGLFYFLLLVNEHKPTVRGKYILWGIFGLAFAIVGLLVALQFEAIYSVFTQRAQVIQEYDGARLGRFARHLIGFELMLTKPLGLGALEFGFIYGEDTHNVYLKSLTAYGWIGFVSWLSLVIWTIVAGFKLAFRDRPWQVYFQIAYCIFIGHLLLGWIIDIDHWRHFYLMLGVIWGCILLEKKWQKANSHPAPIRPRVSLGDYAEAEPAKAV